MNRAKVFGLFVAWIITVVLLANYKLSDNDTSYRMEKLNKFTPYFGKMHVNCRNAYYPRTNNTVSRQHVADDLVSWSKEWTEYNPPMYTAKHIGGQVWADPDITNDEKFKPKWNDVDGAVNRVSYTGTYSITNNYPINPIGRTGLAGRGLLGRWGPNHAADPVVTRWKRDLNAASKPKIYGSSGKPIMQFVAIRRRDSGAWAIPGGMVDAGESPKDTLKREFTEEALNFLQKSDIEKEPFYRQIEETFSNGTVVYEGYVDDPRNTDNAWIETLAMHFHDDAGTSVGALPLSAGDDAASVDWIDIDASLNLYANHIVFFREIVNRFNAHW